MISYYFDSSLLEQKYVRRGYTRWESDERGRNFRTDMKIFENILQTVFRS